MVRMKVKSKPLHFPLSGYPAVELIEIRRVHQGRQAGACRVRRVGL